MTAEEAGELPYLFASCDAPEGPAISLYRRAGVVDGEQRHDRIWTIVFPDDRDRDILLAWLWENMDSWPIWGAIAAVRGTEALSRHLFEMIGDAADQREFW